MLYTPYELLTHTIVASLQRSRSAKNGCSGKALLSRQCILSLKRYFENAWKKAAAEEEEEASVYFCH